MKRVFTMKELEACYSGEWVLLVNPKHIERLEKAFVGSWYFTTRTGTRSTTTRKRKDAHTAIFYVGKLPEDLVVVL
jgi:hypothetical protein